MLQYFFTPEAQLPAGVGFDLFGWQHFTVLGVLTAVSAPVVAAGCRMTERCMLRLMRVLSVAMVVSELLRCLTLAVLGAYSVGYLPLHLCSFSMFICLYWAWHPDSDGGGQMLWSLVLPGALAALLFPDWTGMPVVHFQSLHSFIYHAMLVQFVLIAVISGRARPRMGSLWKALVFLGIAAAAVYPINCLLGTNYMFLNRPVPGSPLVYCARLPGSWGYLLGYALLATAVLVGMNLPFFLWEGWQKYVRNHK